ncbi:MAG TPA: MlaD family protein [Candidatus Polarisedimenticolia bacterium]|nr:MlaD family protein [Candidatus Polarisedimenticolia bacterium]
MSKKASPTAIGIFIFLGLVLLVSGLLLFTSSKLFTPTKKCIIYFDSTLSGLNEGAPVKFRGVTVGSVSQVMIRYNQATNDLAMPVIIELQEDLIRRRLVGPTVFKDLRSVAQEATRGLRAKLATESLVTGLLYVELENEESPPPAVFHQLIPVYVEIPSRPTDIQRLMQNLAKIDLPDLQQRLISLISRADSVLASIKMDEINKDLTNLLISANQVVTTPDLTNAFTSLKTALDQYKALGANMNTNTLEKLNSALEQIHGGMENFRDTLAADSALRNELNTALDQITEAAQSVSALADYLRNHPNGILTGRKPISEKNK